MLLRVQPAQGVGRTDGKFRCEPLSGPLARDRAARSPFRAGLERITATYTLRPDGKVGVVNRGYDLAKKRWSDAKAYAVQTRVKNYLKVYFFPLVPGRYRIAYLDDDYSLAVVSGGSLRYLWLLSRTPEVTPQQRARMLGVARGLGYDTSKLIWPELDEPSGD